MYASDVDNVQLTFHVSGLLWNQSLIMRDVETGSLWSHILGRCVKGDLHETELKILPSVLTDWGTWKKNHPKSTAMMMSKTRNQFKNSFYQNKTIFGFGVLLDDKTKIYSFFGLHRDPLLNEEFAGEKFVIWFDKESGGAWAWQRKVVGVEGPLDFEFKEGKIVDKQTGSTWDLMMGKAIEGPKQGRFLKHVILIPTFQKAWRTFHPETEVWPEDDPYDIAKDKSGKGGVMIE